MSLRGAIKPKIQDKNLVKLRFTAVLPCLIIARDQRTFASDGGESTRG